MSYNESKRLAYKLRHDDEYQFEPGGWRSLSDLCDHHSFSRKEIIDIVANDDKGRYEINVDRTKVRALYGHSVKVELLLNNEEPPVRLMHGTAVKYIDSIRESGLKSKSRIYVHMTENRDAAIKTGSRHGQPVLLEINAQAMYNDGYEFYRISNGIWLTTEVPVEYLIFPD